MDTLTNVLSPAISVIIPVYNAERYLVECMESIIGQTLKNIEIICIDDGSADASSNILERYKKKDKRVRVIHQKNSGYGVAMNIGMDIAHGEYIGIVEADDYIDKYMMEDLYKEAECSNADVLKADYYIVRGEGADRKYTYYPLFQECDKNAYRTLLNPQIDRVAFAADMHSQIGIYKRKFIEKYGIRHNESPGASYQDNGFWFQVFTQSEKVFFLNKPYYYLRRDNLASSIYIRDNAYKICGEFDFIKDFFCRHEQIKERFRNIYFDRRKINYDWTLDRILPQLRRDFIRKYAEDYQRDIEDGFLTPDFVSEKEWNWIQNLIKDPDAYYWGHWGIQADVLSLLRKQKRKLLLYGNGVYATKNLKRLRDYEIIPDGMVVSEKKDGEIGQEGLALYSISELEGASAEFVIIPSVSEKYMDEVMKKLKEKGFRHIVLLSGDGNTG